MKVSAFTYEDFGVLTSLQPEGWPDIQPKWKFYLSSGLCKPKKLSINGAVVGIGTTILHENSAWLANIVIHPDYRNKGLGTLITQALIESIDLTCHTSIQLIASPMGAPIYQKLGFRTSGTYGMFSREHTTPSYVVPPLDISGFKPSYTDELLRLDEEVSGEKRSKLLLPHFEQSKLVIRESRLQGFFLPSLGAGLIIAMDDLAGKTLMDYKHGALDKAFVPLNNTSAGGFLTSRGFQQTLTLCRMELGASVHWKGQHIYGGAGGNLG